jgi:hypothetical protein
MVKKDHTLVCPLLNITLGVADAALAPTRGSNVPDDDPCRPGHKPTA